MDEKLKAERKAIRDYLDKVWTALVEHAGANSDVYARQNFILIAEEYRTGRGIEYRFMGSLGYGGKVWLNQGGKPYVSYYQEDGNVERLKVKVATDDALAKIGEPS